MRTSAFPLVTMLLFAMPAILQAAEPDSNAKLPSRKAGLWELKTSMDEGNGPIDQIMKLCVDGHMEANTVTASMQQHKENCSSYQIKPDAGSVTVDADCMFNERKVVSSTKMAGDFQSAFEIKIDSATSDPQAKDQSIIIKRKITQSGKYLGESCGELKPGEAEGPDGKRVLVQ